MNMKVNIAGVEWKNPVTVASGTFGSGAEFADYVDLNRLGAVTTKGVANIPWPGNPTPRVPAIVMSTFSTPSWGEIIGNQCEEFLSVLDENGVLSAGHSVFERIRYSHYRERMWKINGRLLRSGGTSGR